MTLIGLILKNLTSLNKTSIMPYHKRFDIEYAIFLKKCDF